MMDISKYYKTIYTDNQLKEDLKREDRLRFCFPSSIKNKIILDIGCGPGVQIRFLTKQNEIHGIDLSSRALDYARNLGIITKKHNIESGLPYKDKYFDVVISVDILEHLFDPEFVLAEIKRVLKDDGVALISVPNHFVWWMRKRILFGKGIKLPYHEANEWNYFHIRFFTSSAFEKLLESSEFKIKKKYYSEFTTFPSIIPISLRKKLVQRYPDLFSIHFIVKAVKY